MEDLAQALDALRSSVVIVPTGVGKKKKRGARRHTLLLRARPGIGPSAGAPALCVRAHSQLRSSAPLPAPASPSPAQPPAPAGSARCRR